MQIKIYQINTDRDLKRLAFLSYEQTMRVQGKERIDSSLYDLIFQGTVDCQSLEDVYRVFNIAHPEGYAGRSLSVSDIVEVTEKGQKRFYFCDRVGFKEVEFQPAQAHSCCSFLSPLISELRETIQSGLFPLSGGYAGKGIYYNDRSETRYGKQEKRYYPALRLCQWYSVCDRAKCQERSKCCSAYSEGTDMDIQVVRDEEEWYLQVQTGQDECYVILPNGTIHAV